MSKMRCRVVFDWCDLWIGAFWDRRRRRLFLFPLPCIGLCIEFDHG